MPCTGWPLSRFVSKVPEEYERGKSESRILWPAFRCVTLSVSVCDMKLRSAEFDDGLVATVSSSSSQRFNSGPSSTKTRFSTVLTHGCDVEKSS